MKTYRTQAASRRCLTASKWLSLALVTLLSIPSAAFATPGAALPLQSGAYAVNMPIVSLASVIEVNQTGDGNNVDPSAGCDADAATPGEQCTLRAAIQRAEVLAGDDTITFNIPTTAPNCDAITGPCVINLTDGLQISTNISIEGPGANRLTVRRSTGNVYRVFTVLTTGIVSFSGLSITGGDAGSSAGGGILHASVGTVNITNTIISSNRAGGGGGIANSSIGTVNVIDSLITDNQASGADSSSGGGGGIRNAGGTVNVTNSVIFRNSVPGNLGGGLRNDSGTLNISNSTITQNEGTAGSGVVGPATVKSTLIAQNRRFGVPGTNVSGSFTSAGFNLIEEADGSSGFNHPTDQVGTGHMPLDPKLSNVQIFGQSLAVQPACGSPAIDKGTSASLSGPLTTDVRGAGFPRTIDNPDEPDAAGGDGTDVGAIERQSICPRLTFTVNKTGDADDVNPGDTACDSDAGVSGPQCTLRAALTEANALTGDQAISFGIPTSEPNCVVATGACTINLTRALPDIATINTLVISGPGADKLTVRRGTTDLYRIFTITSFFFSGSGNPIEEVSISGLTISNGASPASGGGIAASGSTQGFTLNINDCKISDNIASLDGGGISASGTLNVTSSTFSGNIAGDDGGGIHNFNGGGNVTNSTFEGNIAGYNSVVDSIGRGGGISGSLNITGSVFTGNRATFRGGGAALAGGTLQVANSIFNGNTAIRGGGINHSSGTLNVTATTITGNVGSGLDHAAGIIPTPTVSNIVNSTISNNYSGGVIAEASVTSITLSITNSTISGNRGDQDGLFGYGITFFRGTLNVTNSTITHNENGGIIGGGAPSPGTWTVKSSIVARNTGFGDVHGAFTSGGFNLIGATGPSSTGFTNGVNNDQVGTTAMPLDPKLDPAGLQNNGGPTSTIALQSDSPAIDKGTANGLTGTLTTDQRGMGFARTFDDLSVSPPTGGDNTDIGAFELALPSPPPISAGNALLINESCPPANGAVDPGERVTVNLELVNTSNAATSSLVATLQTSGGVLAPSAPQNYGVIAANSSVARDFSFTSEPGLTSGQTITATLQLQDGATNLGTVSFNFTAGPTPCTFVRLVVTSSLSRTGASTVVGAITVQNIGSLPANNVTLTVAKLGTTSGTPLPQGLGTLAPGASGSVIVNFNNSTSGSPSALAAGGTYAGGTFSGTKRVTIP